MRFNEKREANKTPVNYHLHPLMPWGKKPFWLVLYFFLVVFFSWVTADFLALYGDFGSKDWSESAATGQWAGALITFLGFGFVLYQLGQDRKASDRHTKEMESQTAWMVNDSGLNTLNVFVEHPEIHPFFYGQSVAIPTDDELRSKAFTAAEMLADHWEITFMEEAFHRRLKKSWLLYMLGIYSRSPTLQEFLKPENEGYRYSDKFIEFLSADNCQNIEKLRRGTMSEQDRKEWMGSIIGQCPDA